MALMIFVIMLLNVKEEHFPPEDNIIQTVLLTLLLLSPFFVLINQAIYTQFGGKSLPEVSSGFGGIESVGMALYTRFFFPFEMISVLLLVALVGVIALAKRRVS